MSAKSTVVTDGAFLILEQKTREFEMDSVIDAPLQIEVQKKMGQKTGGERE